MRKEMTPTEKKVMNILKDCLKGKNEGFVKLGAASVEAGHSRSYISKMMEGLVEKGYVEKVSRSNKNGTYIRILAVEYMPESETVNETKELSDISNEFIEQLQETVNYEVMLCNSPEEFEPPKELKELQKEIRNKDVEIEMLKRQLKRQLNKNKAKKRKTKLVLKVPQFVQVAKAKIAGGAK